LVGNDQASPEVGKRMAREGRAERAGVAVAERALKMQVERSSLPSPLEPAG